MRIIRAPATMACLTEIQADDTRSPQKQPHCNLTGKCFSSMVRQVKTVDSWQTQWFSEWIGVDEGFLPSPYPRSIALLHPGTLETDNPSLPFAGPNAADANLSSEQAEALDRALLDTFGPEIPCTFGRYGGYLDDSHRSELEEIGLTCVKGRLVYYLGAGQLSTCSFVDAELDASGFFTQSFLWADDQSWFVSSEPDLAFTIVGCDDKLANRLLKETVLSPRECLNLPVANIPHTTRAKNQ